MPDGEELSGVGRTSGARNELVAELMKEAVENKKCPFCSPYFEEKNGERVIEFDGWRSRHWKVWHNPSPLHGTSHHIMLASNRHGLRATNLPAEAIIEREVIVAKLQLMFRFDSFTEFSRQGNPAFNAATVYHLHYHVVVSSGEPADASLIPERHLYLIDTVFEHMKRIAAESGDDPLELLDKHREFMDIYREAQRGKAMPIRAKFSNQVGHNQTT